MSNFLTYRCLWLVLGLMVSFSMSAQEEKLKLSKGNKAYKDGEYAKARELYTEAGDIDRNSFEAYFNRGNAELRSDSIEQALAQYELAIARAKVPEQAADAHHNLGNIFLNAARAILQMPPEVAQQQGQQLPDPNTFLKQSIEQYKNALRKDPTDEESRYNLVYAKTLLKEEQGGEGGQDDQQQERQDQENQEEQQENKNSENEGQENEQEKPEDGEQDKQEGDQEKDGKNDPGEQEQGQQPDQGEMTPEQAEQMLKALDEMEKDLQEKMGEQPIQGERIKIEKDW